MSRREEINDILDRLATLNNEACFEASPIRYKHVSICTKGNCKYAGRPVYKGCYHCRLVIAREALNDLLNEGVFDD
jgi:hypothetical protein